MKGKIDVHPVTVRVCEACYEKNHNGFFIRIAGKTPIRLCNECASDLAHLIYGESEEETE